MKEGGGTPSYEMSAGDGVDGATVFSMEKFATHEQIDTEYQSLMQEHNSLVFHIILCLVLSNSFFSQSDTIVLYYH